LPVILLLSFMLASAEPAKAAPAHPPVERIAVASVTIVRAEVVEAMHQPKRGQHQNRQFRMRDAVPMVEFY
jgi:hypothetical protein